jgi:RNA polymerase sigma factor (sigma-70 family)
MGQDELDLWFKREVVVHDDALTRYLRRSWPHPDDIHDLRQETYVRVYEAGRQRIPDVARSFIFTVARRLMADRIRRQRIVAIDSVGDLEALNVVINDVSAERDTAAHQELRQLAEALDELPPKCREVVWMRRVEDLSQKEVAARLGISEKTVEKHVMKGMQRLTDVIFGEVGLKDAQQVPSPEEGRVHGKQQTD